MKTNNTKCQNKDCGHEASIHYGSVKNQCNQEGCLCKGLIQQTDSNAGININAQSKPGEDRSHTPNDPSNFKPKK